MKLSKENGKPELHRVGDETLAITAFRDMVYVKNPVDPDYQKMHVFVPEAYFLGGTVNGYNAATAPIFMPNTVGGYMPGSAAEPTGMRRDRDGVPNTVFRALKQGYVVAAPAIRGRVLKAEDGHFTGKAPACIVDYKAAVRFLRRYWKGLPGDTEKIITNGTSAGGALSSLMGAAGNHPDYEPYLLELGAEQERDDIFAASCYCPIINLENADMAYEWQFVGINDFHRMHMNTNEGGRPVFTPVDGAMTDIQIKASRDLAARFPDYVNSLKLRGEDGSILSLKENGEGSFQEYVKATVLRSAQRALDRGLNLSRIKWLTVLDGTARKMDWKAYVTEITRMKSAPAFDSLSMDSPENDLFGNDEAPMQHFTAYSLENSLVGGTLAPEEPVRLLNPMNYVRDGRAFKTAHWRIRHGSRDRDTSLSIPAMFTLLLREQGLDVDYHSPWDIPHSGDYDLDELFAWIDHLCK